MRQLMGLYRSWRLILCEWPLLFLIKLLMHLFPSFINVNQLASSPERLAAAQAMSFVLSIIDSSELNQWFYLSLTLSFVKGACSSVMVTKELMKCIRSYSTCSTVQYFSSILYIAISNVT